MHLISYKDNLESYAKNKRISFILSFLMFWVPFPGDQREPNLPGCPQPPPPFCALLWGLGGFPGLLVPSPEWPILFRDLVGSVRLMYFVNSSYSPWFGLVYRDFSDFSSLIISKTLARLCECFTENSDYDTIVLTGWNISIKVCHTCDFTGEMALERYWPIW